jgi:hypothetical protein
MNKPLDDLWEQARAQLKADLPFQEVEALVQRAATAAPSSSWGKLWKTIITSMGILIVTTTLLLIAPPKTPISTPSLLSPLHQPLKSTVYFEEPAGYTVPYFSEQLAPLEQDSTPPLPPVPPTAPAALPTLPVAPLPPVPPAPFLLDSLGPKKTFTEYSLEIRKDNSERELKALQQELQRYGIQLHIQQLSYHPDQTIKRFKGRFETDSLFCSTQLQEHEFDIQGAFKSMQFTFRVADEKELKYLKIQSDDFEQTIECYDDQVLTNQVQAERAAVAAQQAARLAQREMERATASMHRAHAAAARSRANILRLKADSIRLTSRQEFFENIPDKEAWFRNHLFSDSTKNMELYFGNMEAQLELMEQLAEKNWWQQDSFLLKSHLLDYSDELRFQLKNMRLDLERDIESEVKEALNNIRTIGIESEVERALKSVKEADLKVEALINAQKNLNVDAATLQQEARALEQEAARLKQAAKELKREAKRRAKAQRAE